MANKSAGRSALSRHLAILGAFDAERPHLTLAQICARTGHAPSSAHRLVAEMVEHGLLERENDRSYRLGIRLWELAARVPGAIGLRESAAPTLHELHSDVQQHIQLGVLQGDDILFIERLSTPGAVINVTEIGSRLPLHVSASGLVLLAHADITIQDRIADGPLARLTARTICDANELRQVLATVRRQGHMVADGCIHPEARSIAVPVRGVDDTVVAAVSLVVPVSDSRTPRHVAFLHEASTRITAALRSAYSLDPASPRGRARGYTRMLYSGLRRAGATGAREERARNNGNSGAAEGQRSLASQQVASPRGEATSTVAHAAVTHPTQKE